MFALVWLYLLGTCLAQNFSLPENCSYSLFTDDGSKHAIFFNASGTLPLKLKEQKDPWYISTAISDERDQSRPSVNMQFIKGFISVPRPLAASIGDKSIEVCSYMFEGFNSSSENPNDADGSCKGVVKDTCIEELETSTLPIDTDRDCPLLSDFNLSVECKNHLTLYQLVLTRNISTENCTIDKIPYLDVPDGYWTHGGSTSSGEYGVGDYDDFDSYDVRVQQTVPIFTVVSGGGISDRKLLCIAPSKVVPGSRKPELKLEENEDEDENTASRVGGLGAVFFSIGVMIFSLL